jgi:hypothetical protein
MMSFSQLLTVQLSSHSCSMFIRQLNSRSTAVFTTAARFTATVVTAGPVHSWPRPPLSFSQLPFKVRPKIIHPTSALHPAPYSIAFLSHLFFPQLPILQLPFLQLTIPQLPFSQLRYLTHTAGLLTALLSCNCSPSVKLSFLRLFLPQLSIPSLSQLYIPQLFMRQLSTSLASISMMTLPWRPHQRPCIISSPLRPFSENRAE